MVPFIYGDKGCDFYIEPEIARFDRFDQIIFNEEGVFELLFETVSAEDEDTVQGFGIFELKITSYSEASGKIVYSDANNFAYDFIYANQEYVVLARDGSDETGYKSKFIFINGSDFTVTETKDLNNYLFDSLVCTSDEKYAFASGSYKNSVSGKDVASFIKIDVENHTFSNNGVPKLFPASETNLNSNFNCLSIKENEIFLAGYIDENYTDDEDGYTSGYPYLVSYDTSTDKVI
ncbi:MAG: hypothetical protein IJ158_06805 [Treponema sp.]|nr:hypothetical protein [Treponema sp.]